jgi:serine kinase of HPr protein (carbohydrate metabolism regulator)
VSALHNIHGTGLLLGARGVILRGPAGAGQSLLALELLDRWELRGVPARLVSDDRIDVAVERGALVMYAPRAIEGLIELRGRGIVTRPFIARAPVDLVVDLVDTLERMIEEEALSTALLGIEVARCPVPRAGLVPFGHQLLLVREGLLALDAPAPAARQKTT